jgi:hypothetical protein
MINCVLIDDREGLEVATSFPRVPCVGEFIEPRGEAGDWPDDAAGATWRVTDVRWVVDSLGTRPMLDIAREPGPGAHPSEAAPTRPVQEIIAELARLGVKVSVVP